ncbi:MAG: CPBP family intramembrane metalloprotease [Oscillospiraceae bacterium]|nr:CPBP family intramembrane metalloprotease [Oscillospiraceae bacterium]
MIDWKLTETQPQFERIRSLRDQRVPENILILLLLAAAYWGGTYLGTLIVLLPFVMVTQVTGHLVQDVAATPEFFAFQLYLTLVSIGVTLLISRAIECRTLRTMGITKHHCVRDYLLGMVLGFAMFAATVCMAEAAGAVKPGTPDAVRNIPLMLVIAGGWIIQGFSEEFAFRGFMLMSAGTHHKPWIAVLFNALVFGAVHIGNDGASVSGVLNVALFGVTMSLFMLRTDSIWGPAALHTVWNWAQGSFFGLKVSGLDTGPSVLRFEQTGAASWMGGGAFGLEAGIGTTIVNVVLILILLFFVPQRKAEYPAT